MLLGARGAVGHRIRSLLAERGHTVIAVGRAAPEAGTALDAVREIDAYRELAAGCEAVVNAAGLEDVRLADIDSAYLDISASATHLNEVLAVGGAHPRVIGVGLAPGLSTLLAASVGRSPGDEIDVGVVLGSGETHGAAAVEWTIGLLGQDWTDAAGDRHRGLAEPRILVDADGRRRRMLRADFPDDLLLDDDGARTRTHLAVSSRLETRALGWLSAHPRFGGLVRHVPPSGSDRWQLIARNRRTGMTSTASGRSQSAATALLTALTLDRLDRAPAGGVSAQRLLDLELVREAGIDVRESIQTA
nr:NAD-dependent epimerase/dehydratase family protein [Schumannella luteola]